MNARRALVEQRTALHLDGAPVQADGRLAIHQEPGGLAFGGFVVILAASQLEDAQGDAGIVLGFVEAGDGREPLGEAFPMSGQVVYH